MGKTRSGIVAAIGALAICVPGATAGGTTEVTIKEKSGDFSGKVQGVPASCRANRLVKVKMLPSKKTIASDTSDSKGAWNTGNTGADPGDYFAKVKKTDDCSRAKSRIVTVD